MNFPQLNWMLALIVCEAAFILYAALTSNQPYRLRGLVLVNLIVIAVFGPKMFSFDPPGPLGPWVSNVTSICYAAVFCVQTITKRNFGHDIAYRNVSASLYVLAAWFVITFLVGQSPRVRLDNPVSGALAIISDYQSTVLVGSFLAFVISQAVLLVILWRVSGWKGVVLGTICGQIADSCVFYPIAFSSIPIAQIANFTVVGFCTKIVVGAMLAPVYYVAIKKPGRRRSRRFTR